MVGKFMKKALGSLVMLLCVFCFDNGAIAMQFEANEEGQFAQTGVSAGLIQKFESYRSKEIKNVVESVPFKKPSYAGPKERYENFLNSIKKDFDESEDLQAFQQAIDKMFTEVNYYIFTANIKGKIKTALSDLYQVSHNAKKGQIAQTLDEVTPRNSIGSNDLSAESAIAEPMQKHLNKLDSDDNCVITQEDLYLSMESAWGDLNDYEKRKNMSDLRSAVSSVISYIANGGEDNAGEFLKNIGRICYEHHDKLTSSDIAELRLTSITNIETWGLVQLRKVSENDSEVRDYLHFKGL